MNPSIFEKLVSATGWTLVHFLWQATLVFVFFWISLQLISKARPHLRFIVSAFALSSMFLLAAITFVFSIQSASEPESTKTSFEFVVANSPLVAKELIASDNMVAQSNTNHSLLDSTASVTVDKAIPWIVGVWVLGIAWMGIRFLKSILVLHQWKRSGSIPDDQHWNSKFKLLCRRLGIYRAIELLETGEVNIPMVIGWIKPVILVPTGFLTSLPIEHVEAILLHELAHVRRHDFLINLLQTAMETLFFFHPAVWWFSRQMRHEREFCCDRIASERSGGSANYVRALTALELKISATENFGVAANGGSLLERVRRLNGKSEPTSRWSGFVVVLLVMILIAVFGSTFLSDVTALEMTPVRDTTPPELRLTPHEVVDGKPVLAIRVIDHETGDPISKFKAIAGVDIRKDMLNQEFVKRHGDAMLVNWQPHTVRVGKNGEYKWPMNRMYNPLGLRVEAEGYIPNHFMGIDKTRGAQTIVFRLHKDSGIRGRVLLPDGSPAANAEVGIGITMRQIVIKGGKIALNTSEEDNKTKWERPPIVRSDEQGYFVIPTETDLSATIVAVHDEGVMFMDFAEFRKNKKLKLKHWGRVECNVFVGKAIGRAEELMIYTDLTKPIYPNSVSSGETKTSDKHGRVVFNKVAPGSGSLQMQNYIPKYEPRPFHDYNTPKIPRNASKRFHVKPGKTIKLKVGGAGLNGEEIEQKLVINIDNSMLLDGKPVSIDDLTKLGFDADIKIHPAKDVDYQYVILVVDAIQKTGVDGVSFGGAMNYKKYQDALTKPKIRNGNIDKDK